jgi:hypothetical protein
MSNISILTDKESDHSEYSLFSDEIIEEDEDSDFTDVSDVSEDDDQTESTPRRTTADTERLTIPPSSGPIRSSPVTGDKVQRIQKRRAKGQKHRGQTLQAQRQEDDIRKEAERRAERHRKRTSLKEVVELLHFRGLRFWDLMEYVFNPANGKGAIRYNEFFSTKRHATKILDWWLSGENRGRNAKEEVRDWIVEYSAKAMRDEARAVTRSKKLQTMGKPIDAEVVEGFDFEKINGMLQNLAPFSMCMLKAATTSQHIKKHSENRKARTKLVR